jgi:hypothetical protein
MLFPEVGKNDISTATVSVLASAVGSNDPRENISAPPSLSVVPSTAALSPRFLLLLVTVVPLLLLLLSDGGDAGGTAISIRSTMTLSSKVLRSCTVRRIVAYGGLPTANAVRGRGNSMLPFNMRAENGTCKARRVRASIASENAYPHKNCVSAQVAAEGAAQTEAEAEAATEVVAVATQSEAAVHMWLEVNTHTK